MTLTSGGTKVGSGDGGYIWCLATWDEVNDIPDVVDVGNYMRVSLEEPSELDIRLPASDILEPPWLAPTGTTKTDSDISTDTKLMVSDGDDVELGEIYEHHDQFHTGLTSLDGYEYKTGTSTPDAGDVALPAPGQGSQTGSYYIKPLNDADKALIKNILIAHKEVRFQVSATNYIKFEPSGTPAEIFGRLTGSFPVDTYEVVGTALTNNQAVSVEIQGNIAARGEFTDISFKAYDWESLTEGTPAD